jgi:3D-(3,5/4)-trihydroxycyclohexane-1,2-dione acylhydrolase (decyclizing)
LIKDCRVKEPFSVDFAKHAESMGAHGRRVETLGELDEAMKWAQANDKTTVLTIPSDAYEWTPGDASWDVGVPEVSERDSVNDARKDHDAIRAKQRIGV